MPLLLGDHRLHLPCLLHVATPTAATSLIMNIFVPHSSPESVSQKRVSSRLLRSHHLVHRSRYQARLLHTDSSSAAARPSAPIRVADDGTMVGECSCAHKSKSRRWGWRRIQDFC